MSKIIPTGFGFILVIVIFAWVTAPEPTDNCTPRLIAKYTNDIISYKDCEVMPRCIIEPSDVRYFRNAQLNFSECVMKIAVEAQREIEKSKEENEENK